ncbi:PLA2G6 [Bugula neritina]|uniref:phospholipase A2 n=1 Tax=Bugula neritina TaxID=10212 RepID=A0A7J7JVY3_BUGNE|nr:PLA2G6 [Bugula neritina]
MLQSARTWIVIHEHLELAFQVATAYSMLDFNHVVCRLVQSVFDIICIQTMNFISSLVTKVSETLSSSANYSVTDIPRSSLLQYEPIASDDACNSKLCKTGHGKDARYIYVLTVPGSVPKYFRLFQLANETEALSLYTLFSSRVVPLVSVSKSISSSTSKIQDICHKVRENPSNSVTHLCVKLGLKDAIKRRHPEVARNVNALDDTNSSPLHLACLSSDVNAEFVKELIVLGADVTLRDIHGDTAFHHAARNCPQKLQMLLSQGSPAVNCMNIYGETAAHIACTENQPECLELLLMNNADPMVSESYKSTMHCAVKAKDTECVRLLAKKRPQLLSVRDGKFGGTALHWATSKEVIVCLLENGAVIDALSNTRDTPLHVMLKEDRRECVNCLLTEGADVTIPNHEGKTPLHIAIPTDDLAMVRSLVVFGADVNSVDRNGNSPRHLAATQRSKNSEKILATLHLIGAARCVAGRRECREGCSAAAFDDMMNSLSQCGSPSNGYRVLCLDGGGIRGLVLSIMLIQLEKLAGKDIRDCFDWISGTSTGGILALALTYGRNARYCLGLYFKLKSQVFSGSKPYNSELFEKILMEEYGEHTLMSELPYPRFPPDLHIFRNYENPLHQLLPVARSDRHGTPPKPNEVCIWQAARSSGAAPTFFTASMNMFLDGGLMANNPTIDTLTEIQEFTAGLKAMHEYKEVKPIKCVVSLGTGRCPKVPVTDIDVYRPFGLVDAYKVVQGATSLLKLIVEQATQSEGRPSDRARAWCSAINSHFFRLSPQLSLDIDLDETSDDKLLLVCWETMVYLHHNQEKIARIASIVTHCSPNT